MLRTWLGPALAKGETSALTDADMAWFKLMDADMEGADEDVEEERRRFHDVLLRDEKPGK